MAKNPYEQSIFDIQPAAKPQGPVECLGMTFDNDKKRRDYFLDKLREKLKDPEFRKIEGFPIGSDEDILALSDPPYYTACPNPFIADFVKHFGKPYDPSKPYSREPFAADVSEGKNDPIYNAHSYHTKVPHKAIMRYILHYTEPGDVVFDGFCGSGMTGVAAQLCGDKATVESLGYRVDKDGVIYQQETDENGKAVWKPFSKLGARRAVLNDLSPAATFIAYNYNTPVDVAAFEREAKRILKEVEDECGWMYETLHTDGKTKGKINYTVWSEVYSCPQCSREVIYYETAFKVKDGAVEYLEEFECPHCRALCAKNPPKKSVANKLERVWVSSIDKHIGAIQKSQKRIPVRINYSIGTRRYEKRVDDGDLAILEKALMSFSADKIPTNRMLPGDESRRNDDEGITHTHHFYTNRVLSVLSVFIRHAKQQPQLEFLLGSVLPKLTIMNRYMPQHGGRALVGPMANTLYVPPVNVENNVIDQLWFQYKKIAQAVNNMGGAIIATQAAQSVAVPGCSIDYIFLDPPFGANIMYSELSFIREAWLRVFTNGLLEAVESKFQKKGIDEYRQLMTACFMEAYRVLKPGRWMTVEFSNTKASVWNSIQTALSDVGFIVASVAALDKTRGGLHAMIGPTAVKQDLVISAYKPNGGFEDRFQKEATTEEGAWDFVRTHLKYLPVVKRGAGVTRLIAVTERDPRILYDQMVAYYVRKGYPVPINSAEFQEGLTQRFSYRDGMYFLPDQVAEYDKKKMTAGGMEQMSLFVSDESSAIVWLRQLLKDKPLSFQDIHPLFIKELGGWQKYEKPLELSELLEQNFLRYDGKGEVPNQIHSYLSTNFKELRNLPKDDERLRARAKDRWYVPDPNKAGDLEKLRERSLLKEFEEYRTSSQKRLKVFRLEAVRAGFKKAWQERDYATIITVARKVPENVLQEDPKLLMWYDQALTRSGEE
ncbi:MAG: site-specific DNA-methyltransferase [Clostridiaceae bacterium]|jgi:DNA modification methylase|nr:site-specific DNA-methyltransferase [Clostridiaceae bacterium]